MTTPSRRILGIDPGLRRTGWGIVEAEAIQRTIAQHEDILRALEARDPVLAEATALVHVATTEAWLRQIVAAGVAGGDEPIRHARRQRSRADD